MQLPFYTLYDNFFEYHISHSKVNPHCLPWSKIRCYCGNLDKLLVIVFIAFHNQIHNYISDKKQLLLGILNFNLSAMSIILNENLSKIKIMKKAQGMCKWLKAYPLTKMKRVTFQMPLKNSPNIISVWIWITLELSGMWDYKNEKSDISKIHQRMDLLMSRIF